MIKRMILSGIVLFLFAFSSIAGTTTYYVSKDGNDSNPGTEIQPWLTIQKAANDMNAGDTVLIKAGTYIEEVIPQNSGSDGNWITYQAFDNNEVIIESPNYRDIYGCGSYCIALKESEPLEYLHFKNLTLKGIGQQKTLAGFQAYGETWGGAVKSHIILEGLTIKNAICGVNFGKGVTDSNIVDCDIYDNGDGISLYISSRILVGGNHISYCSPEPNISTHGDGIILSGGSPFPDVNMCSDVTITNNIVHDVNRQGILVSASKKVQLRSNHCYHNGATGIQIESDPSNPNIPICINIVIEDNLCEDNASSYASETGIWVDDSNDVVVQNNILRRNDVGLEITGSFNVIARNNIIYENNFSASNGIAAGLVIYPSTQRGDSGNNIIVHNTLYRNGDDINGGKFSQVLIGRLDINQPADNVVFKNNISSNSLASYYCDYLDLWVYGQNQELNYNNYYQPVESLKVRWQSNDINGWSEYLSLSGQDANSITTDPCFINPDPNNADFHLRAGSECMNVGGFLTFTDGNGTDSNALVVQDTRYFSDGYGLIEGDLIKVGSNPVVRILDVNYDTNTIIIDQNLSWNNGDGVSYDYLDSSPDIGAYEYGPMVYNVNQNISYEKIQYAINDSNNGDEIVVYPGTYYESIDFNSKTITLRSAGTNDFDVLVSTVIEGDGEANVVTFSNGSNSTLKGLTLTGGVNGVSCTGSSPLISNCIIKNNTNNGVYAQSSSAPVIKNCFIYDNTSGLNFQNSDGTVRNNTIVNNINYGIQVSSGDGPEISNCILWNNGDDLSGCSATYSDIEDGDAGTGNIISNPLFIDADNNDFHIDIFSPCVNAGNVYYPLETNTDIDGDARIIGSNIDMGADEVPSGVHNVARDKWYLYIQPAVADACSGDEIVVYPGVYEEAVYIQGKTLNIHSYDPNNWDIVAATVIDNNGSTNTVCLAYSSYVNFSGFTINGGHRGLYFYSTNSTVRRCIIEDCNRGVDIGSSTANLVNNIIRHNRNYGIMLGGCSPSIKNNLIYDNNEGVYFGGYVSGNMYNNTIVNNSSHGIYCGPYYASCNVKNSILWDNGDDLYGNITATYCDINDGDAGTGNICSDPCFVDTDFFHIDTNSPCIDIGDSSIDYSGQKDIDNEMRVIDISGKGDGNNDIDIGADEYDPGS